MDNPRLCSILSNLQRRLSINDQERLDLYLKNDVPKPVKENSRLGSTLKQIQALFDQYKINNDEMNLLIDALIKIRCFDAVNTLKEHQRRMSLSGPNPSPQSLALILPSHTQKSVDDHDYEAPYVSMNLVKNQVDYRNSNIYDTVDISDTIINEDVPKKSSSQKPCCCVPVMKQKCFVIASVLFLLTLGILIYVLFEKSETQSNQRIKELNRLLEEKSLMMGTIFTERCKERNTILIKAGRKFGGDFGRDFDDSFLPNFTTFHYLSGIHFSDIHDMNGSQFIYTSSHVPQARRESNIHGNNGSRFSSRHKYELNGDERIKQVQVRSSDRAFRNQNGDTDTRKVITGLKFITTKNRAIPSDLELTGNGVEYEQYLGYTLGYVTGKSERQIDQLQFFWYRTEL